MYPESRSSHWTGPLRSSLYIKQAPNGPMSIILNDASWGAVKYQWDGKSNRVVTCMACHSECRYNMFSYVQSSPKTSFNKNLKEIHRKLRKASGSLWQFNSLLWNISIFQWEFQDLKIEVLYHIRPYFVGIFPYIGLTQALYMVGTSNLGS